MSLICGALKWLMDYESKQEEELRRVLSDMTLPSTQVKVRSVIFIAHSG